MLWPLQDVDFVADAANVGIVSFFTPEKITSMTTSLLNSRRRKRSRRSKLGLFSRNEEDEKRSSVKWDASRGHQPFRWPKLALEMICRAGLFPHKTYEKESGLWMALRECAKVEKLLYKQARYFSGLLKGDWNNDWQFLASAKAAGTCMLTVWKFQ